MSEATREQVLAELVEGLRGLHGWLELTCVQGLPPPSTPPPRSVASAPAVQPGPPTTAIACAEPVPASAAPVVPAATAAPVVTAPADPDRGRALVQVRAELGECTRCKLHAGRHSIVFGQGSAEAELVFVGEGPGAEEDRQGLAFVGAAGELLTRMIEGMGLTREQVYICNIVKCRPPGNRDPEPDEVAACEPFLRAQLEVIKPRVIVTLGKIAAQTLLRSTTPVSRLRGQWTQYQGIDLMPTFHPAYLLRNPSAKRQVWDDLKSVLQRLGRSVPEPRRSAR